MKYKIFSLIMSVSIFLSFLCGCGDTATLVAEENESSISETLYYVAEFYDNYGCNWMTVPGKRFDIKPNRVKEYAYNSNGTWGSSWTTSSVISVDIDGNNIETCGSTVIFYDCRLEKLDTAELTVDYSNIEEANGAFQMTVPPDLDFKNYWNLTWWYKTKMQSNTDTAERVVIIQSQNGDPICMFKVNEVSWELCANLPKTTEIMIDGMPVYIHRANFSIVDLAIFE